MDGARALALAYRMPAVARWEVGVEKPFAYSSTLQFFDMHAADAAEAQAASLTEIRLLDRHGDGEFVEVSSG